MTDQHVVEEMTDQHVVEVALIQALEHEQTELRHAILNELQHILIDVQLAVVASFDIIRRSFTIVVTARKLWHLWTIS